MLRYCAPFGFLLGVPVLYYMVGPVAPLATIAVLAIALVTAEWIPPSAGREETNEEVEVAVSDPSRILPLLYIPLQLAVLAWATWIVSRDPLTLRGALAMVLSVGVLAGVFGMLAAHEMVHSPSRFHRGVGFAMLMGTGNPQFRIAHIFGHHRYAGTERDAATARLGESFYAFLVRTLFRQWSETFAFERRRCARRGQGLVHNRALHDALCLAALVGTLSILSWRGAVFYSAESTVAIIVLELFNYIAHYGLVRRAEPHDNDLLGDAHSWNSSNALANLLIFNMGRHSDHHRRPTAPYPSLVPIRNAPELPAGYAGSILLALIPPLWRHVMDRRVLVVRSRPATPIALAA